MGGYFTIGEISKIFGIPIDTLRYYAKIKLLMPKHVGENRYRYYSIEQFESISTIIFLRAIGTPIEKVREMLHQQDITMLQQELLMQEERLASQIKRLKQMKKAVADFHAISQGFDDQEITVKHQPTFYLLTQPFQDDTVDVAVADVVKLHDHLDKSWAHAANIVTTISEDNLMKGHYHSYTKYGLISETPYGDESPYLTVLEAGYYVCTSANVYKPNHADVDIVYDRMLAYIEAEELTVAGEAMERNVLDMYANEQNDTVHFIKIYIPVKERNQ